ncbi:MAG: endonuclease/exonuclease/phosphatase family protein [Planctomycetota bacterium]|nr:endonuclease/exonuclease/phosphatase family protein [Planctomycetota bacterium]
MPRLIQILTLALSLTTACSSTPDLSGLEVEPLLSVMSFNVRYGTANDGDDRWEEREQHVLDVIAAEAPTLLAVQEALDFQADAIAARMPHFAKVGQHREGGTKNEFSGMFVDTRRLAVEASGDVWLSETPDVVGSVGWDAALTRNATWARLRDLETDRRFVAVSTHFDHRGQVARLESARLLGEVLAEQCRIGAGDALPLPGLLLGDLNAAEDSRPLDHLRSTGLADTFRLLNPDATEPDEVGTFTGFRAAPDGRKIDYVLATPEWTVRSARILRPRRDGRAASDHDPVVALVALLR